MNSPCLLSIAIPAYNRPSEIKYGLDRFIEQISGKYDNEIEIIVSDDCSPDDGLKEIREIAEMHSFITYRRYPKNIGLEQNLLACTDGCKGEFLWIFGDDDFIEANDGLDQIMDLLRAGQYDFYILNRTRRSFDLSKLISQNWMKLDETKQFEFAGLKDFCLKHGFISVLGFISVNIFRRIPFKSVDPAVYFGTMYPQLGTMLEAFHSRKTLLIGKPLICHRTQTAEEKKAALGAKKSEADFMADVTKRNATYFSHPYVRMLDALIARGGFAPADIVRIPENTVINGLLVDFLINTVVLNHQMRLDASAGDWAQTASFFGKLPLDGERRQKITAVLAAHSETPASPHPPAGEQGPSISVISPSYNQAEFLAECLASVRDQTYKPIEHLVFDPGSKDGSQAIAAGFPHVTLITEPDEGQSDALNKGFRRVRGDIIAWLNSDDCFAHPQVFERVVRRFLEPDSPDIVYGTGIFTNESGEKLRDVYINKNPSSLPWRFQHEDGILQPALFMRRSVVEKVGLLRNDLHYCMDYEYWIRCVKAGMKFAFMDEDLAIARYHSSNKTYGMRGNSYAEVCDMMKEHFAYVNHIWLKRYAEFLAEGHDGVLANSDNTNTKDQGKLDAIYRSLLYAYNTSHDTYALLVARASEKGYGDTLREMKSLGVAPTVPSREVALDVDYEPGCVCYTVGTRRWAYDTKWKAEQIAKSHAFLRGQIAKRRSDTCVVVGNGPSLNKTDLSLLKGHDVIVSNNVFLSKELLQHATYYTVVNYLVAEQSSHHINRLNINKVLPYWMAYCLAPTENTYFVDAVGRAEFSKDMFKNMSWRHTVTFFNLHLAYGLGYRKVIMIGFDHSYKQPKGVAEQEVIHSYEVDENHFHPSYFRGKKWQAADVDMMEEMYSLAKAAFEEDGREIINATVGGKLELFKRMPLDEALRLAKRAQPPLIGPFPRSAAAHWDETDGVAQLFSGPMSGGTMIDVGAHHGHALIHFLEKGWRVYAFEPDEKNRKILVDRLAKHRNGALVKLDPRAVSNESKQGLSYYRSDESTGISGLSAFHPTHKSEHTVDTVTLTEALAGEPITSVDFFKIDTEGYDLFVLKSFPWERCRPAVIECEFEDLKTVPLGYTFHDLAGYVASKGYTVYVSEWHPIMRYGIRHDWKQLALYPCELTDKEGWGNLLAFRNPIDESVLVGAINAVMKLGNPSAVAASQPAQAGKPAQAAPAAAKAPDAKAAPQQQPPPATLILLDKPSQAAGLPRFSNVRMSQHFRQVSPMVWKYTHSDAKDQKMWQAIFEIPGGTQGCEYVAGLRFKASKAVKVQVNLSRFGDSPYEGKNLTVHMAPDAEQRLQVSKDFAKQHSALKIQIELLQYQEKEPCDFTIDSVFINESLASASKRIASEQIDLKLANRLFREGDYVLAMNIYLLLRKLRPLGIYADNALMCAGKLGMGAAGTLNELLARLGAKAAEK